MPLQPEDQDARLKEPAKPEPAKDNKLPLPKLATAINAKLAEVDTANTALVDLRLAAGTMLAEAKQRCDKGTFEKWCKTNIKRSQSDIRALMALVKAPDPVKARETEKARAREGMAATRQTAKNAAAETLQRATPKPDATIWAAQAPTGQHAKDIAFCAAVDRFKALVGHNLLTEVRSHLATLDSVRWNTLPALDRDLVAVTLETLVKRIRNIGS